MTRREAIESAVRILAPRIPRHEFDAVTDHALGSRGLYTATPEVAAWLSLTAYIRHRRRRCRRIDLWPRHGGLELARPSFVSHRSIGHRQPG